MIIDPGQIQHEIARGVSDEGYLPLRNHDFTDICPNPSWGIHVCAQSVDAMIVLSRICLEWVLVCEKELKGIIVYIRGSSLTMNDFSKIDGMIPRAQRFRGDCDVKLPRESTSGFLQKCCKKTTIL